MKRAPILIVLTAFIQIHVCGDSIPVTSKPVNESAETIRFAIMGDRTGGMRPGVFEIAAEKVDSMQPEFIISVGDLIDGYTEDLEIANAQWDEFNSIVDGLETPFYYVSGNHDVTNPALTQLWQERLGDDFYSFVYKNALFMVLNSEDVIGGGLGANQIAWATETLKQHTDVSWTYLFFHRPLWLYENQAGYEQIEQTLAGRQYTVFTGHHHHYMKAERQGMNHYVLATCGGASGMRGAEFGEFDHITWVTTAADGPRVSLLELDGIVSDEIVTSENSERIDALRDGSWLEIEPALLESETTEKVEISLSLQNEASEPLHVTGRFPRKFGLTYEPSKIDVYVAPNSTQKVVISGSMPNPVSLHSLNESKLSIELEGSYEIDGREVSLSTSKTVAFDWIHSPQSLNTEIILDGDLSDWSEASFTRVENPCYTTEGWDWKGPEDGFFEFAVVRKGARLLVGVRGIDDQIISFSDGDKRQDLIQLHITTSREATTLAAYGNFKSDQIATNVSSNEIVAEFSIPIESDDETIQLNIAWVDHDRLENTKPSTLWWRDPGIETFGIFKLKP